MAYPRGIDISSYQASSLAFMQTKKQQGARFAIVKLTEGTRYLNPKASAQITNGLKVFNSVGVYHFFHGYGLAEAKHFLGGIKAFGLDTSTVLAIDVEASDLPTSTTSQVNVFLKYLIAHGYKHVITYGSASWFNTGRIKRSALVDKHIWVAAYNNYAPGVANANAWQYTDNFHGVDASLDFDGSLSGTTTVAKPSYYQTPGLYEVRIGQIHAYNDLAAKSKRYVRLRKGSRIYGTPVKYGKITRLKTPLGYFTTNKAFIKFIKKAG
ncbi:hypothetical protein YK48G_03790 [Lentilactobacillus fungorum]|uniref:Lysozyme n=1 Tax=Lentilactobacillus fungorum TaxID=2201250 RepID=A0ABQ3VZV7_9LACO|nr:GH25 family lysozyme [Lentilactobacillus fungorum]GHP12954.1 hypothetical protein YK48G_03790 [Lentilactobacillus fungorum]